MLSAFVCGKSPKITAILLLITQTSTLFAQARNDPRVLPVSAGACTVTRSVALLPESGEATPDARYSLSVVSTATGALIAYRTAADTVYIARVDDALGRVARDRVVSGPVAAFSLASAPGGAVLLSAERDAQDGRDEREMLLFARLDTAGNARNIPRLLARVLHCDGVAVTPSATGFLTAWGTVSGPSTSTLTLDVRGIPNAAGRIVVDGSSPRLVALTGGTRFAMTTEGPTGQAMSHIDETGAAVEGWPLMAPTRALVTLPSASIAFGVTGDSLSISRWWPGNSPTEFTANSLRAVLSDTRILQSIGERNSAILLVDVGNASEQFVRVQSDGTATLLASRTGTHGAFANALDSALDSWSFFSAAHTVGHAGIELQRWLCPRTTVVSPLPISQPSTPATDASVLSSSTVAP